VEPGQDFPDLRLYSRIRFMDKKKITEAIKASTSQLKKQLLVVCAVTKMLEEKGKSVPVIIGGCALAYYSREVYFTADIDLAYADSESLSLVLDEMGFRKEGRYWLNEELSLAIEAPASSLAGEDSQIETVEFEEGLYCKIIGVEDLIIDRLNACKHWKSTIDCEMAELLLTKYKDGIDWDYLEKKSAEPQNDTQEELLELKNKVKG
jgi:hypothetical protein